MPFRISRNEIFGNSHIRGFSEDRLGIKNVWQRIKDLNTNQYWNGIGWQGTQFPFRANLNSQEGLVSDWNYDFQPPIGNDQEILCQIEARAVSLNKTGEVFRSADWE